MMAPSGTETKKDKELKPHLTLAQRLLDAAPEEPVEPPVKTRKVKKKAVAKSTEKRVDKRSLPRTLTIEAELPSIEVRSRKSNEMLGVVYICLALVVLAALTIDQEGQLKNIVHQFVRLNGVGPVFLALFGIYCGVRRLMGQVVFEKESQILAFPIMYFSLIGFLAFAGPPQEGSLSLGGVVGNYCNWILQSFLGSLGSGIVLASLFLVSFMHVTEVYITDIAVAGYRLIKTLSLQTCKIFRLIFLVVSSSVWSLLQKIHQLIVIIISDSITLLERSIVGGDGRRMTMWLEGQFVSNKTSEEEIAEESHTNKLEIVEEVDDSDEDISLEDCNLKGNYDINDQSVPESDSFDNDINESGFDSTKLESEKVTELEEAYLSSQDNSELNINHVLSEELIEQPQTITVEVEPVSESGSLLSFFKSEQSPQIEAEIPDEIITVDSSPMELDGDLKSINNEQISEEFQEVQNSDSEFEEESDLFDTPLARKLPSTGLLQEPPVNSKKDSRDDLMNRGLLLVKALDTYKVTAELESFVQGPTITRFELKPAPGTKLNKILNLSNEIAMSLAAKSVRIEAPIPGTSKVGIEIPNKHMVPVYFKEVIQSINDDSDAHPLSIAFGKGIDGKPVVGNLAKMPHLLVAGATGAGKSVCVNTLISSMLFRCTPEQVQFVMIDPKQVEFSVYKGIPHLITDVVTKPEEAAAALRWGVDEMEHRYTLLSAFGVRHIDNFNSKLSQGTLKPLAGTNVEKIPEKPLPYIVMIVDELADLMMVAKKDVENSICRIAQKARAVGIHLVIATQRPSVDVITGLIKANLPSRISFMVTSGVDSKTILDQTGAENLLGRGDMLYLPGGQNKPSRVQGAFMDDDEVALLVDQIKTNFGEAQYEDIVSQYMEEEEEVADDSGFYDDRFNAALDVIAREKYVSTSMLQRHLGIGYNRAARIVDVLYARGICGASESGKKRKLTIPLEEIPDHYI
ncbi:MAG: DNA translocase FtsK 4TM domain-containing protein [bacterium]|nr:DNA translocase FtsK 4TM domain-containing protein [bacterium]